MRVGLALTLLVAVAPSALAQDALPAEDAAPSSEPGLLQQPPPGEDPTLEVGVDVDVETAQDATPAQDAEPEELGANEGPRSADKGAIGIGLILGEPTGISAKLYLQDDQAIQAAVGFAFIGGGLHVHADYVFHPYILQSRDSFVLPVYVGPGIRAINYSNGRDDNFFALGARGVGGLLFDFREIPLDAFVEVAAVLEFGFRDGEGLGLTLNAAAGARYYF